jgi:hypothetical protein
VLGKHLEITEASLSSSARDVPAGAGWGEGGGEGEAAEEEDCDAYIRRLRPFAFCDAEELAGYNTVFEVRAPDLSGGGIEGI